MAKHKSGLHKEITAIFDGVRVPRPGEIPPPSAPAPEQVGSAWQPSQPQDAPPAPPQVSPMPPQAVVNRAVEVRSVTGSAGISAWAKSQFAGLQAKSGDSRQKITLILMPVLFVLLIFMLTKSLKPASTRTNEAGSGIKPGGKAAAKGIEWPKPEIYPETLRDPMKIAARKGSSSEEEAPPIRGIMYSVDKPAAIISDQIMYEGDKIGDIVIKKIKPDGVEFELNGKRWIQRPQ